MVVMAEKVAMLTVVLSEQAVAEEAAHGRQMVAKVLMVLHIHPEVITAK